MSYKNSNLIVVGDKDWPGTICYLSYLRHYGYRVKKLLLCDFYRPLSFKNIYQKIIYKVSPCTYKNLFPPMQEYISPYIIELYNDLQNHFDIKIDFYSSNINYEDYCDVVEKHKFWDYNDRSMLDVLKENRKCCFLYTSGGIVPKKIFDAGINILHVHPGYIPFVRGSDGMLWSLLHRKKLGYSCFFMNSELDGGDLLFRHELELNDLSKYKSFACAHPLLFYRALLLGYDTHLRAQTLIKTLEKNKGLIDRNRIVDKGHENGHEFYRMHPRLIKKTIMEWVK